MNQPLAQDLKAGVGQAGENLWARGPCGHMESGHGFLIVASREAVIDLLFDVRGRLLRFAGCEKCGNQALDKPVIPTDARGAGP